MPVSVRITEDLNREWGNAVFSLTGMPPSIEEVAFCLYRHGHPNCYLGEKDWQAHQAWLKPVEAWYDGDHVKFVVSPDLVSLLEPQGYELRLRGKGIPGTIETSFFWPTVVDPEHVAVPDDARVIGEPVRPDPKPGKDELERQERKKQERERQEREQQERVRQEREQQERERQEREQQERERQAREHQERERQAREHQERERQAREQQERKRKERERPERKRRTTLFVATGIFLVAVAIGVYLYAVWEPEPEPDSDPVTPDPITLDPITPDPVTPDPVIPNPVTPDPVTPDPITPDPVTPDPVTPYPVTPDPVMPDPVTPDPVTPDPVTPDPVTPDPVTPDPVTPNPVTPDPFSELQAFDDTCRPDPLNRFTCNVLENDSYPETMPVEVRILFPPSKGKGHLSISDSHVVTFLPGPAFTGSLRLEYVLRSGTSQDTAVLFLTGGKPSSYGNTEPLPFSNLNSQSPNSIPDEP